MPIFKIPLDISGQPKKETNELSFVLRPSPHDGVGVFCTHAILNGSQLRLFPGPDSRFIAKEKQETNTLLECFCHRWGLENKHGSWVSHDFGCMEIGWYLNHSDTPNAYHDDAFDYFASRDIAAGEEITIDYKTL